MNVTRRLEALRSLGATAAMPKDDTEIPNPDDLDEDETETKSKKKDKDMTTVTQEAHEAAVTAARAEGVKEGTANANARTDAVMASDHYAGRETLAKTLLPTELNAEQIATALAASPKIEAVALDPAAVTASAEAVQTAVMREAISANVNSAIDVSGGGNPAPDAKAKSAGVWERANAKIEQRRKGN